MNSKWTGISLLAGSLVGSLLIPFLYETYSFMAPDWVFSFFLRLSIIATPAGIYALLKWRKYHQFHPLKVPKTKAPVVPVSPTMTVRHGAGIEVAVRIEAQYAPPSNITEYFKRPWLKHTVGIIANGLLIIPPLLLALGVITLSSGWTVFLCLFVIIWGPFFLYHKGAFKSILQKGIHMTTCEQIRLIHEEMMLPYALVGSELQQTFLIDRIRNLRVKDCQMNNRVALCFEYDEQNIMTRPVLFHEEAQSLVPLLVEIITFRPHLVERIVFGRLFTNRADARMTLTNPEVASMTMPFERLRQIVIMTDSYDFYQLERFVTYSINVIGRKYLKQHVTVSIYGETGRLHSNLRNTLTNLCRHVSDHHSQRNAD